MGNGMLRQAVGGPVMGLRDAIARGLIRLGIKADWLTVTGLPVNIAASIFFAWGWWWQAALAAAVAGALDILDGAVARVSSRQTRFGAFLDSTIDRYSDVVLMGGIAVYYMKAGNDLMVVVTFAALAGALVTSYARARAENFLPTCKVGLMERGERTAYLILGALIGNLKPVMWVLAVLTNLTVVARVRYSWQRLNDRPVPPDGPDPVGMFYRVLFWDFERASLPYDIVVATVAIATIVVGLLTK